MTHNLRKSMKLLAPRTRSRPRASTGGLRGHRSIRDPDLADIFPNSSCKMRREGKTLAEGFRQPSLQGSGACHNTVSSCLVHLSLWRRLLITYGCDRRGPTVSTDQTGDCLSKNSRQPQSEDGGITSAGVASKETSGMGLDRGVTCKIKFHGRVRSPPQVVTRP